MSEQEARAEVTRCHIAMLRAERDYAQAQAVYYKFAAQEGWPLL